MTVLTDDTRDYLQKQLVKLGDMMGDGEHLEPGGKWISAEYRKVAQALGYMPKVSFRQRNPDIIKEIDLRMAERVTEVACPDCKRYVLQQTRSGSMTAVCTHCQIRCTLLRRTKKGAGHGKQDHAD